jgi:L-alanine-DL-glutamate epimerase-like enolase superfamily enzyme
MSESVKDTSPRVPDSETFDDVIRPGSLYSDTADLVIQRQNFLNDSSRRQWESSKLQNTTLRQLLADAGTALSSTLQDLLGNTEKKPLYNLLTDDNRLRGLGFVLALCSAGALLIQAAAS